MQSILLSKVTPLFKASFFLATVVAMSIVSGATAYASVLYQQTDTSDLVPVSGTTNGLTQYLGTGLSGTMEGLAIPIDLNGYSVDSDDIYRLFFFSCTSEDFDYLSGACSGQTVIYSFVNGPLLSLMSGDYAFDLSASPHVFDESKHYYAGFYPQGFNSATPKILGSISNPYAVPYCVGGGGDVYGTYYGGCIGPLSGDSGVDIAIAICDVANCALDILPDDTSTRFITVNPLASSTVATTTTIGADIYINENEYSEGMYLSMSFTNQSVSMLGGSVLDAWNDAFGSGLDIRIPLSAGLNEISTTTTFLSSGLTNGTYTVRDSSFLSEIPFIGTFFTPDVFLATSTYFYVGYKTQFDVSVEQGPSSVSEFILTGTTTGANTILNCSNLLSGGLTPCVVSFFVPNSSTLSSDLTRLKDGFLSVWPLGYVTRFIEITLTTASSTLPAISYTTSSDSIFGEIDIELDPFGTLLLEDSPVNYVSNSDEQKTIWEIMEYPVYIVVYLTLLFMILHDITGVSKHFHHKKS